MKDLEEWECHVSKSGKGAGKSYCGVDIGWGVFYMADKEQAIACIKQETRIQPCPECYKKIKETV